MTTSWQVWDNGTVERFKPTIITGLEHTLRFSKWPLTMTGIWNMVFDISGRSLDDDIKLGDRGGSFLLGVNMVYDQKISIRLGRNVIGVITAGMGLSWKHISLDYAFLNEPSDSGLGSTHLVSLSVDSDWVKKQIEKL